MVGDALAQQIDFYPTFAELAGLSVPEHCQGRSLKPVLDDPTADVHESVYCLRSGGHMLRTDAWAYLLYPDGSAELYDMARDPRQFTNLAEEPAHAEQRTRMQTLLDSKLESMGV